MAHWDHVELEADMMQTAGVASQLNSLDQSGARESRAQFPALAQQHSY